MLKTKKDSINEDTIVILCVITVKSEKQKPKSEKNKIK